MFTNVTLIFILLLIPLSGFIAWAGDRIGHKSGKKRHSLWGLRPRHTAMVFTIGTGMSIALVSFGLFYAASERFRVLIMEGESLVQRNRELKHDNERQALLVEASQQRAVKSRLEAEEAEAERQKADIAAGAARKQAKTARTELAAATLELTEARRDLSDTRLNLNRVQDELGQKTARLRSAEERLTTAQRRVITAEEQVARADAKVKQAETDAQRKVAEMGQRTQKVLLAQRDQLDKRLKTQRADYDARLTAQKADLEAKISAQSQLYTAQAVQTEEQRIKLAQLNKELDTKRAELNQIVQTAEALRGKTITYQIGEEVDRISIRPGHSVWRIQNILDAFLSAAAKKAETRGAGRQKEERAVLLLPGAVASSGPTGRETPAAPSAATIAQGERNRVADGFQIISEVDTLRTMAMAIRRTNEDVVVIARAAGNAVAGEPVVVVLKAFPNPVLFRENEKIAETHLDGNGSRQEVADALYAFLRKEVRGRLLKAGILPQFKGEGAAGSAADETAAVVNLSGDEWLRLMEDIRQSAGRARVTVKAARDLRVGDTVTLKFEVKGVNGGGSNSNSGMQGGGPGTLLFNGSPSNR